MSQSPTFASIDDAAMARLFDTASRLRGAAYARQHRVMRAVLGDGGRSLSGTVLGSALYEVGAQLVDAPRGWLLTDRCTCPMGGRCKHVVAVLEHVRGQALLPTPARESTWEDRLAMVIPPRGQARRFALVVSVTTTRFGHQALVKLEPRLTGTRGWVKGDATWARVRTLSHSYGEPVDADQLAVLQAMQQAVTMHAYYGTPEVTLTRLGSRWFDLLSAAQAAGVALLGPGGERESVVLSPETGAVVSEVIPPTDGQPATLETRVSVPLTGDPWEIHDDNAAVTGWVTVAGDDIVLARAQPVIDQRRRALARLGRLEIPAADWARFAVTQLPELQRLGPVTSTAELPAPGPPRLLVQADHLSGHRAHVRLGFTYAVGADQSLDVALTGDGHPARDPVAESALVARVGDLLPAALRQGGGLADGATFRDFATVELVTALERLRDDPAVVVRETGESLPYRESVEAPVITIGTAENDDTERTDWFDLSVRVAVGEEHVDLAALIEAIARGERSLLLPSGTWFSLDRPELGQLAALLEEARGLSDRSSDAFTLTPLHAALWEDLVGLGVVTEQSARWRRTVTALLDEESRAEITVPDGVQATLRPYQLDGYRWLSSLWDAGLGGVLADDMGLGKTLQVLTMLERARAAGELGEPALIVCPTSVVGTWVGEAEKFCPGLRVVSLGETRRKARRGLAESIAGADVVVTSYAILRIDEAELEAQQWSALVLDEAQFVKNRNAKSYAAARHVRTRRTFVLTGTPLENSLMDLWSLLSLAAPGLFPRPEVFKETYATPIERRNGAKVLERLRRRIAPLMLRRTKESVATELPPRQETVVPVPLAAKHRGVYDRHLQRERQRILGLLENLDENRLLVLRALTVLRELALDPALVDEQYAGMAASAKVEFVVEQIRELAAEGHRALVFSQFTRFLTTVRERLEAEGLQTCYLDGRTRRRQEVVDAFRAGTQPAFLISLKAGGFGLTLTEADYVFVLDPWWNPAAEMQAIDRAHRIGQTRAVNVYRLVSSDTIEEKVVALQQRKRELFSSVVGDGDALGGALTADDLRALLEP